MSCGRLLATPSTFFEIHLCNQWKRHHVTEAPSDASVISTGGGGTVFEHSVGASFLGLLLSGAFLPAFPTVSVATIHFQARRLGWETDDFVVEGLDSTGQRHLMAVQVKRTFLVSANDTDSVKTLLAAWNDFHNAAIFDDSRDGLLIAVHLGTNRLLGDFGWLLTQAKTSSSTADFTQRLAGTS